jgi:hypothetical protein
MKSQRLPTYRPTQRGAREIAAEVKLTEPARAVLAGVNEPGLFLAQIIEKRLYPDAVRFTAHRLPKASSVWWGCLCAWEVSRGALSPAAEAVFKCIMSWLGEPTEELRREAEKLADAVGADTPAGMLALAVFMSGDSIAPPDLPKVTPKAHLSASLVANAVLLASRLGDSGETALQRQFLVIARDVLEGRSHWKL